MKPRLAAWDDVRTSASAPTPGLPMQRRCPGSEAQATNVAATPELEEADEADATGSRPDTAGDEADEADAAEAGGDGEDPVGAG